MTNQIALWESAAVAFASRCEAVDESNTNLPTPCPDFDVAALVEHASGTQKAFVLDAAMAGLEQMLALSGRT